MAMNTGSDSIPRWDFHSIEPYIDAQKEATAERMASLSSILDQGQKLLEASQDTNSSVLSLSSQPVSRQEIVLLEELVTVQDQLSGLINQLLSYSYCRHSVETANSKWVKLLNSVETLAFPLNGYMTKFFTILRGIFERHGLSQDRTGVKQLLSYADSSSILHNYEYYLEQSLKEASYRMTPELETLAGDLQRSAGDAWGRLQGSMGSEMNTEWNPINHERCTMVRLRNLASHSKQHIRKKAYNLELKLWKKYETVFAASLNGVKGNSLTIYSRRGYKDFLQPSIQSSRISQKTLDALISAMEDSLPMFRRYFRAKAGKLGLKQLSFYDLFAPLQREQISYSFLEVRDIIVKQFFDFSEDLGNFATKTFENNWIDAEPRSGKVDGAYMTDFPLSEESRIMLNFDGSFDSITTLAHELGHGYHSAKLEGFNNLNRGYPMTLAETASIFCETIVYNALLTKASDTELIPLIDSSLMGSSQIIVDILSRFYFEKEVFNRRKEGELSPQEFCEIMLEAQRKTYGDGLNNNHLHPYMWAVKGHYYRTDLAFYNYPYAFGQLFAMGLYAKYKQASSGFSESYIRILQSTGIMSAVELCAREGFDIEDVQFWKDGLSTLESSIDMLQ